MLGLETITMENLANFLNSSPDLMKNTSSIHIPSFENKTILLVPKNQNGNRKDSWLFGSIIGLSNPIVRFFSN